MIFVDKEKQMEISITPNVKTQLLQRRKKLEEAIYDFGRRQNLLDLLNEVDDALERIEKGSYGLCEVCHDPIEEERLIIDPLVRFCLDHLNAEEQRFLEQDLTLASKMQLSLLPKKNFQIDGWDISYIYEPAGPVSGDYCDIIRLKNKPDNFYFILGDVSGKGIAASLLMTQIHAMVHSLLTFNLPVNDLMGRINRLLTESALPSFYATLVIGYAGDDGNIDICNAGHCPPLLISNGNTTEIKASGIPIGLFCSTKYEYQKIKVKSREVLFLYTDGLYEAVKDEVEYGLDRVTYVASESYNMSSDSIINRFVKDLDDFTNGSKRPDDLTLMALKRK